MVVLTVLMPLEVYGLKSLCFYFLKFILLIFLWLHLWHVEIPRLGIESELQLPAYNIAIAMPDLSHICSLHLSSQQHWILNPLSKARDQTCILMDTSPVCYC